MFYKEQRICFRKALIIGSGGGLGTATAKEISQFGDEVVVTRTSETSGVHALKFGSSQEREQLQTISEFLGEEIKAIIFGQVGGATSGVDTLLNMTLEDHCCIQKAENKEDYLKSQMGVDEKILEARWEAFQSWKTTSADSIVRAMEVFKEKGAVSKETVLLFFSYFSEYSSYFPQSSKQAAEENVRGLREEGFSESYSYRGPEIVTKSSAIFPLVSIGIVYEFATKVLADEEKKKSSFWKPLVDRIESLDGVQEYLEKLPRIFSAIQTYGLQDLSGTEFNFELSRLLTREGMPRGIYMFLAGEISKALLEVVGYEVNQVVQGNREAIQSLQILPDDPSVLQGNVLTPPKAGYESKLTSIPENFESLSLGLGENDIYQVFREKEEGVYIVDGFKNDLLNDHFGLVPGVAQVELLKHYFPVIADLEQENGVNVRFRGALLPYSQVRPIVSENRFMLVDANDSSKIYTEVFSAKKAVVVPELGSHTESEGKMIYAKGILPHGNSFRCADHIFYDLEQKWAETLPVSVQSLVERNEKIQEVFQRTSQIPTTLLVETVAQIAATTILREKGKAEALFGSCDYRSLQADFQFQPTDEIIVKCQYDTVKEHIAKVQQFSLLCVMGKK